MESTAELLTLHAVRLKGMADERAVAQRFDLDLAEATDLLLDFQAYGWVTKVDFAGTGGWTLTQSGLAENQRQLAAELAATGSAKVVGECYRRFVPRNARLLTACTDWQLRPTDSDPLAVNDHSDPGWDRRVLDELADLRAELSSVVSGLAARLSRFGGYDERFAAALRRAEQGDRSWVTAVRVDSCHTVWMELHEDLLASLGLARGSEPAQA